MRRRLLILTALAALAAGTVWWWVRGSLPHTSGVWPLPGLGGPVEILADGHGVPHVYARDSEDAWFAVGVLHARDRAWQMELYRRAATGRLSALLGARTLDVDKRMLTLGLAHAAEAEWQRLPADVRRVLERYAAGVNAVFETWTWRTRPLELQLLQVQPAPWSPADSLAIARLMTWRLAENHRTELLRHALARRFGRAQADRLLGAYPADGPTILDRNSLPPPGARAHAEAEAPAARDRVPARGPATPPVAWPRELLWLSSTAPRGASNSWVVSGRRTTGGRPLLANDPHLAVEMPGVWYEQRVAAAGLDVRGVAIPGVPFVAIGHTARVAWGLTNSGADVQDLFVERFDVAGQRYLDRGTFVPVEREVHEIAVRGGEVEPFEVWRTARGTVFTDEGLNWDVPPPWLSPRTRSGTDGERRALVLAWHGLADGDLVEAFARMNTAMSAAAFRRAVGRLTGLSQNIVYADVEGAIGYALSGSLPVRAGGDGTLPSDGWQNPVRWTGAIEGDRLPRLADPPAGFIATANNEVDRHAPVPVTRDWVLPYRARRLAAVLGADRRFDVEMMAGLQLDLESLAAADVLAGVPAAIEAARRTGADASVVQALERLRAWDRRVDGSRTPALYQAFEHALWRRTFLDEMDEPLFERFYEVAGAERHAGIYAIVADPRSRWFDDIGTVDRQETRADIMVIAAADAVELLAARLGGEGQWAWDRMHRVTFVHPLGAAAAPLGWLFNRGPIPVPGDSTTVLRTSIHRLRPFDVWEYPSFRQILDVGAWDEARLVVPAGQSGHPLSRHYFDQNVLWREGRYRRAPHSRAAVEAAAVARLLLVPAR